jgi:hypothetical protein
MSRYICKGYQRGEDRPHHKLTEDKVRAILSLLRDGAKQVDLAKQFNVSAVAICRIKKGSLWAHVREVKS